MSCNGTPKRFQTGARSLENGKNGSSQSLGWGDKDSVRGLGDGDGLSWLNLEIDEDYTFKQDESVTSRGFKASPRLMGIGLSKPISFLDRYYGQNDLNYWMFGFENAVKPVIVFSVAESDPVDPLDPFSYIPSAGDTFTDGTYNYDYLRTIENRGTDNCIFYMYVFENDGTNVPSASGQLTAPGGTFDYTAHSGQKYEHLFELDKRSRQLRDFTSLEQPILVTGDSAGWEAGDKRNIMMTIGKRYNTYDARVQNAMCKSFSWGLTAGDLAINSCDYVAYKKEEGDYDSDSWTLQPGGDTQDNSPAHYETFFKIGTTFHDENLQGGDMLTLNAKQANVNVEIPVDESQTYTSGLYMQCPLMNDEYNLTWDCIIGRHDTLLYQQRLRSLTKSVITVTSVQGYYVKELLIKRATLTKSGADNSDIAEEPLEGTMDDINPLNNPFTTWLSNHSELQDSPIVMRTIDDQPLNSMFLH